jgi:hypothetical protein
MKSTGTDTARISLISSYGKKVLDFTIPLFEGTNPHTLTDLNIPPGIYYLKTSFTGFKETHKVVKLKH